MKFYEFREDEKRVDIFNERFYKIGDKFYRNVTTILNIVSKGVHYDEWLKQTGYNSEIIVDRAGKFGTAFHQLVERYLLEETVKYHDNQHLGDQTATALWERFMLWLDFWKELNEKHKVTYKPSGIEFICYDEVFEYAGTIDLVAGVDDKLEIFDWKTGNYLGNKEKLQMSAYMNALKEMAGKEVSKANLIHLPAKKPNKKGYRVVEVENTDKLFNLFTATQQVFNSENKDQPKVLSLPLEVNIKEK